MNNRNFAGSISLVLASVLYGFYGTIFRFVGEKFGTFFWLFCRSVIVIIILLGFYFWQKTWRKIEKADYKWFGWMSFPGLIATIAVFVAFNHLPIGIVYFIFYASATVCGYLVGFFIFKEKLTTIKVIFFIASMAGLFIIFYGHAWEGKLLYLLLALLGGAGTAAWNTISKKVTTKYPRSEILFVDSFVYLIITLPIAVLLKESLSWPTTSIPWLAVMVSAIIAIGTGLFLMYGFKKLQAQTGSLIMLLEPVFGTIFGLMFFRELLTTSFVLGGLLILSSSILPIIINKKEA
ncbi:MAG: DMT family transporter [Candidatus Parcubacteria bacterium]|nr:DMT family transporter [Candidatus Parcubacteria bacterium]